MILSVGRLHFTRLLVTYRIKLVNLVLILFMFLFRVASYVYSTKSGKYVRHNLEQVEFFSESEVLSGEFYFSLYNI